MLLGVEFCWMCLYLLGGVARREKRFTVFPAALERLKVGTGVVVDQVLLQMLNQPKDQWTAMPLETQNANNQTKWEAQKEKTGLEHNLSINFSALLHDTSYPAAVVVH